MDTYLNTNRGNRITPKLSRRNSVSLRLLLAKLKQMVSSDLLPVGETLLDYGCGDKPYQSILADKFTNYVGADLPGNAEAELAINPDGTLPTQDVSFDCVLSSQVLEHVPDPELYLREAFRVLKPGGSLIISTHGVWPYHPDPNDYWRWTIEGLQLQIQRAGFEIEMVKGVFGMESVALQLWQDSTFERLPKLLQSSYTRFFQFLIKFIERRQPEKLSNDAAVYLILARKGNTK